VSLQVLGGPLLKAPGCCVASRNQARIDLHGSELQSLQKYTAQVLNMTFDDRPLQHNGISQGKRCFVYRVERRCIYQKYGSVSRASNVAPICTRLAPRNRERLKAVSSDLEATVFVMRHLVSALISSHSDPLYADALQPNPFSHFKYALDAGPTQRGLALPTHHWRHQLWFSDGPNFLFASTSDYGLSNPDTGF